MSDQPARLTDELGIDPVQRYSTFDTQDGPARQCQICGSTCWPGSTDPMWPAALEHVGSCPLSEIDALRADLAASRAREAAVRKALLLPNGLTCRICADSWLPDDTHALHHPWCPLRVEPSAAPGEGERPR